MSSVSAGSGVEPLSGERRFQRLIESVKDYAIYMLNPEGIVSSWNAGAQRFKGYTAEEIIGQHFSRFFTEEDRQAGVPQRALAIAQTEGKFETEGWRVRKDGTRFWASVVVDPIYDEQGVLVGFAKVTRDITERKMAQEALQQSEQRFRLLVQGVVDYAIYMLDPNGNITNWNSGAQRLKGYTAKEITGQHFSRFYSEEDQAAGLPAQSLATAAREGKFETEGWRERKDGTRFWASVVIDAIRGETGELIGFAKVTRDITERRQTQEALEQAREALFQSQKMEALGQLTGGIAHDFNNLLTVIVNSLDLLSRKMQGSRDIRLVENAHRAAERGAKLTQQLLAFARRQALHPQKHNINNLIDDFEAILRRACGEVVDLEIDMSPRSAWVNLDAPQFEAALLNLVVNARDAMPGGGQLKISTTTVELSAEKAKRMEVPPGAYTVVAVEDNGVGIPPDLIGRVLEPFYTTKPVGKGTGLGLSQVYGFVRQSGGHIDISSTLGQGTRVQLYLPLCEGAEILENDEDAIENIEFGTVLIVEDEADVREIAIELFRTLGYSVLTATNGVSALNMLKRPQNIDILFTDVVMPAGLNGVELAQEARRLRPELQILLASGYPLPALSKEGLGEFAFISKPYRWTELAERLKALRASSSRQA